MGRNCFRVFILTSSVLLLGLLLSGCYLFQAHLVTESQPSVGGSVSPSESSYKQGTEVSLTATAFAGYKFDHWEGDISGTSSDIRLIMDGNKKIVAVFKKTYALNVSVTPSNSGTVTPGSGVYDSGSKVILFAEPSSSEWRFDRWEGDLSGQSITSLTLVMNSEKRVTAHFVKLYTVTTSVSPKGGGSATPYNGIYGSGAKVTLAASPATGWIFDHWEGDASGTSASITITVNSDKTATAFFKIIQYTLTTSVAVSGSGNVSPVSGLFDSGKSITISATPTSGWSFDHWGGDLTGNENPISVVIDSNKNIIAFFTRALIPSPHNNLPSISSVATQSTELISRSYSWNYRTTWNWEITIPASLYDYYRNLPRPPTTDYSVYVTHPLDDPYIDALVGKITEAAQQEGFAEYETVEFATTFIQSLPYTVDSVTTPFDEYPRYPIETLVDYGGDCEDTSILLASILDKMGYGVVLLEPPNHLAVGLKGDNINGTYWEYGGNKYYYIETTGENWGVGELPDEYKNASASIYPLIPVPILTDEFSLRGVGYDAEAVIKVKNLGTAPAQDVVIFAGFDAGGGMVWNSQESQPFTLGVGQETTVKLNLLIPAGKHTRLLVQIILDGVAVDESYTDWFDT